MSIAPEGSDERAASTGDLYGAGSYFASQACKTLQSCDDLPSEERPQCLRTQHTRPDGYDGIDFTRCHSRDRLRSTTAPLDSSACQFMPLLLVKLCLETLCERTIVLA